MKNIRKVLFSVDFLSHDWSNSGTYHDWFFKLIKRQIFLASNIEPIEFKDLKNKKNKNFDRAYFFELSNIKNVKKSYFSYKKEQISKKSINYLKEFLGDDVILLGCELGLDLREILTENGITYINCWFHPFKLFDDIIFLWGTNNKDIYKKLQNYQIEKEKFYFYANYWKIKLQNESKNPFSSILNNSLLFIGQTMVDKSVEDSNGKMLNITDFDDKINELAKHYNKIYYVPHPLEVNNKKVDSYIKKRLFIEKIISINSYKLLSCDKFKKVVSLSSSMLYEARFFEKDIEYFHKPLFDIDGEFSLNTFISIYDDYLSPRFWSDILNPIIKTNKNVPDLRFDSVKNKVRDIRSLYWGYGYLDKLQNFVITGKIKNLQQIVKDIENLKIRVNPYKRILNKIKKLINKDK